MNQKIFIIGMTCSGKSYLASRLSEKFNIPHFDLDDIKWIKKYSERRTNDEFKKELSRVIKDNDKWAIEGAYGNKSIEAVDKADTIIWLDINYTLLYIRAFRRELIKIIFRKNTFKDFADLLKWLGNYKKPDGSYNEFKDLLESSKKEYITLKNNKEIRNYLKK